VVVAVSVVVGGDCADPIGTSAASTPTAATARTATAIASPLLPSLPLNPSRS
jgi:hypothetical protein